MQKMIREEFWALVYGDSELNHHRGHIDMLSREARIRLGHNAHCLDYIRQLIICHADMTLEPRAAYPASNGNPYHIDGYGTAHTCKNHVSVLYHLSLFFIASVTGKVSRWRQGLTANRKRLSNS
jgi:hypothetical protein